MRLQIVGTKATRIIGKELEIRRTLSETHLYSSAFEVEKVEDGLSPSLSKGEGASGIAVLEVTMALSSLMTYSVFSPLIII